MPGPLQNKRSKLILKKQTVTAHDPWRLVNLSQQRSWLKTPTNGFNRRWKNATSPIRQRFISFLHSTHPPPPQSFFFFFFFLTKFSRENFQVGLRRIDAALDALRPMGFAEDLVRSTVSELLEVSVFNYSFGCWENSEKEKKKVFLVIVFKYLDVGSGNVTSFWKWV